MAYKKQSAWIIVLSIATIIVGLFFVFGYEGDHSGAYYGLSRASTSIEFGADFYTTMAQATGLAANAIVDLYSIVRLGFGIIFIISGLYMFINESKKFKSKKTDLQNENNCDSEN